jgi:hypothetical protein
MEAGVGIPLSAPRDLLGLLLGQRVQHDLSDVGQHLQPPF